MLKKSVSSVFLFHIFQMILNQTQTETTGMEKQKMYKSNYIL